ncbi:hypothetical protein VTN31DRAFT_2329 [Thermomyces dupontii]|uniref:uncharacterized protein n=1 Tax=Talaromyces thermophilus TaxID=28565 RepID=UPI0037438E74
MADVPVAITTPSSGKGDEPLLATQRRITPSWTVGFLKGKLETMTGIPPGSQRLLLKSPGKPDTWLDADDETVGSYGLYRGCEIEVHDTRPPSARPNFDDLSSVQKFELPQEAYEKLPGSVLAWKKEQKLGRFDPNAKSPMDLYAEQGRKDQEEVEKRGIATSRRAIILPSSPPHLRRGTVQYIGPVPEIAFKPLGNKRPDEDYTGPVPLWVGIQLDEPTGKNDGSVNGKRYFDCPPNYGVFVKPERVEVGDFPPLEDLNDEDMEEI